MSDNEFIELDDDEVDGDLIIGGTSSETSEDEGLDVKDCQMQIEPAASTEAKGQENQGQQVCSSNQDECQGQQQESKTLVRTEGDGCQENDQEILQQMQHLDHERTSLTQHIESEEKNRNWYYDQIDMITQKICLLPVMDGHPTHQQPGLTRKHLDFEISRLRQTMLESFGTNEQIQQRRDARMQRIHQVEAEMIELQQHHEQWMQQKQAKRPEGQECGRCPSSLESVHSSGSGDRDTEQITLATQTEESQPGQHHDKGYSFIPSIPGAVHHRTWSIDENLQKSAGMLQDGDVASVMSFNSTNMSSSRGSLSGGHGKTMHQQQPQPQTNTQAIGLIHMIPLQPLGTKVEMVYSLLSMLGTHDKDDMSRTLLAISSSHDSCTAMRQSGCLPLLIQLLHGSDKDSVLLGNTRGSKAARMRAAAALHNIVHSHPDDKRGRKEARVLRLLEQIRAHCDQLNDTLLDEDDDGKSSVSANITIDPHPGPAIATLMKLSFDEEHRHAICTLGGLHAIAELLQVDNEVNRETDDQYCITMRRYACMALTNLTFGDGTNKALLCSMKRCMEALVAQLFSTNEELCQVAASVLRNLSWKADLASKKTLREVGAVSSLMQASMRVEKETTLKSILSALWNLSAHCSENKADVCAVERALEFLIRSLQYKSPSKTTAIIENGGGILRNVSSHIAVREDYRKILRQHGCLQILLKHLRSPSLTIVSNACGTLWNLSARCAEDQQALWEMGAVGMLRNLVNSKHKMISMGSSAALKNLLAARPAMKNIELNKQANANRPTLHARKQRALESEIDQNLSETCENVESPRDSPVESKKPSVHFIYPVYPVSDKDCRRSLLLQHQVLPRSQSGDNALCVAEGHKNNPQGVARSGSQDSIGSVHSDISHDRSHHVSIGKGPMGQVNMGGSLDRHSETFANHWGQGQRIQFDGRTERNPLGVPNSRILQVMQEEQVMQEVAVHAGTDGQSHDSDSSVFKAPLSASNIRLHAAPQQQNQNSSFATHLYGMPQQKLPYHMYMMANILQPSTANNLNVTSTPSYLTQRNQDDNEKPLDYSMKYCEGMSAVDLTLSQSLTKQMVGNFDMKTQTSQVAPGHLNNVQVNNSCYSSLTVNETNRFGVNSACAEACLNDLDQTTDCSACYSFDYNMEQYRDSRFNYGMKYNGSNPNCANYKSEEARRCNDQLEQTTCGDQVKVFCTEETPYLSTAKPLTAHSTAVKIPKEAEEQCPADAEDDVPHNFILKYGEYDKTRIGHERGERPSSRMNEISQGQQQIDRNESTQSSSQMTGIQTATTTIANYNLTTDRHAQETNSYESDEPEGRSFDDNRKDHTAMDHTKIYCEDVTTNIKKINPFARYNVAINVFDKPIDYETNLCKSEGPDNLSKLSCITSNIYGINNKTLVKEELRSNQHFMIGGNRNKGSLKQPLNNDDILSCASQEALQSTTVESTKITNDMPDNNDIKLNSNIRNDDKNHYKDKNNRYVEIVHKRNENGKSPNSDVSEVKEKILANIISSAMPINSRRIRKSSSDNSILKKSCNQEISSNTRIKTPAKSQSESSSKSSSVLNSAKKLLKLDPADAGLSDDIDAKLSLKYQDQSQEVLGCRKDEIPPVGKKRSKIPRPVLRRQLPQLQKIASLNISSEAKSVSLNTDEGSPFSISNTQSVIARSAQLHQVTHVTSTPIAKLPNIKPTPLILQTAKNLSNAGMVPDECFTTYATEHMPFSGSLPGSLGDTLKNFSNMPLIIDTTQDTVQSFAAEDTRFGGSATQSPATLSPATQSPSLGNSRLCDFPQIDWNDNISQSQFKQNSNQVSASTSEISHTQIMPVQSGTQFYNCRLNRLERSVSTYTSTEQSKTPTANPNPSFNTHLLSNVGHISDYYDAVKDTQTKFVTEETPMNYSVTGSFSDMSSLNANFDENVGIEKSISSSQNKPAEKCASYDSSPKDENEDFLPEVIQSARPAARSTKGQHSVDRQEDGAEKTNVSLCDHTSLRENLNKKCGFGIQKSMSVIPTHCQPQRTFVPVQDHVIVHTTLTNSDGYNQVKTYAAEDIPNNFSEATLSTDLSLFLDSTNGQFTTQRNMPCAHTDESCVTTSSHTAACTVANDSVYLQCDFEIGNSLKVCQVAGTPQSFSCNKSLSSLGIVTDEGNDISQQVKSIAHKLIKSESISQQNIVLESVAGLFVDSADDEIDRPDSRSSVNAIKSALSVKELAHHVVGQSSDDQSIHCNEDMKKQTTDEVSNYKIKDMPVCFSRNSSLSPLHDLDDDEINRRSNETKSNVKPAIDTDNKLASKDESACDKVEHTSICFSRNSSLASLSVHSNNDDDPNAMDLLEECISSALLPCTECHKLLLSSRTERADTVSIESGSDNNISINHVSSKSYAFSDDELEQSRSHDSRILNLKQPYKSDEEIFWKPTMDAAGHPCHRSGTQDSKKHLKNLSNRQLINVHAHKGSFDSLTSPPDATMSSTVDIENHLQEIISVSKNHTHPIENHVNDVTKLNGSTEKLDENESEKSPFEDYNFFMTCSGLTEISVESISKQSFPSSMAPDDFMDYSFSGSQNIDAADEIGHSSCKTTFTDRNVPLYDSLTGNKGQKSIMGMEKSLTLEDEQALAENARIVMSEMMVSRMLVSNASMVDEENFIENETLLLVANEYVSDTASECSVTGSAVSDSESDCSSNKTEANSQMNGQTRIVKPGDKAKIQNEMETEVKAIRGKRKHLYSSKSVSSASLLTKPLGKNKSDNVTGLAGNISPKALSGAPSFSNTSGSKTPQTLQKMPQTSSTPVKSNSPSKPCSNKSSPMQKNPSFEQKIQNVKSVSAVRSVWVSSSNSALTRISSRSSQREKVAAKESTDRPKILTKQATFIKESTNKNAPVISPNENKQNISSVKMQQNKLSESSQMNRNSSGSLNSNLGNTSYCSLSTLSGDSPPDSMSKTNNTNNLVIEQVITDAKNTKKEPATRGSLGANQTLRKHRMNSCPATTISSPVCVTLNKTSSGSNLENMGVVSKITKSSSGTLLGRINGGGLMKTGSVNSLKQNSRPATPVNMSIRKGSSGSMVSTKNDDSLKKNEKKTVTSKFVGLWKSEKMEEKYKIKSGMKISSKLPVAKSKTRNEAVKEQEVKKRESSPKQSVNRNTYIINESVVVGISKSSTYDKLNVTNDKSRIPSHDQDGHDGMIKSETSTSLGSINSSETKSMFEQNSELNKTCMSISALEIGVELNLVDAWECSIEKSIEGMSKSIEDNMTKIDSFYDDTVDTSKMDLTGYPAKRLSKSGSMSEIELQFGRIHSGTFTKKKSHNDFNTLPNAEETSRVIPLVKRSESLNFHSQISVSQLYDLENEDNDVWIKQSNKMRNSDVTMSRKKKKSVGGSSSFLNVVNKMFGVSKKSGDKQAKSSELCKKHTTTKNESNVKVGKNKKEDKSNKSETKIAKAEAKWLKVEQITEDRQLKMQTKMKKREIKASKQEAKLSKQRKSEISQNGDNTSQHLSSSSTSSLKRSMADSIDIDKSEDEDDVFCMENEKVVIPLSISQTLNEIKVNSHSDAIDSENDLKGDIPVPKNPGQKRLTLKSDLVRKSVQFSKPNLLLNNADQSPSFSVSVVDMVNLSVKQRTEQGNASTTLSNALNKSLKLSNSSQLTKTEMLLARRQLQLSAAESGDLDEEVPRTFLITAV